MQEQDDSWAHQPCAHRPCTLYPTIESTQAPHSFKHLLVLGEVRELRGWPAQATHLTQHPAMCPMKTILAQLLVSFNLRGKPFCTAILLCRYPYWFMTFFFHPFYDKNAAYHRCNCKFLKVGYSSYTVLGTLIMHFHLFLNW